MAKLVDKTVTLTLVGMDGNAFNLLGTFSAAARRQGWTQEEIDTVLGVATAGDYDHLLRTLMEHTEPEPEEEEGYDLDDGWDFDLDWEEVDDYYDYAEDFEDLADPDR